MTTYYAAETEATATVNDANADCLWQELTAKTLTSAKRAASQAQMFQGTTLHLAVVYQGDFARIAVKRADALNMNHRPVWQNISEED
jgi:hypothetical protein|tara:strand:+ start:384 stop:644 length:261 start_codon:yes stop_codon:yes gene_type:complete